MNKYIEEEIKVLNINSKQFQKTLRSLGAKKVFDGKRIFTTFDTKDRRYSSKGIIIRLTEEDKLKLSINRVFKNGKVEAIKIFVSRKPETVDFLSRIGLFPIAQVTSHRVSYVLGEVDIDIDKFPKIPAFVEVDTSSLKDSRKNFLKKLGLENKEVFVGGTEDVYAKYSLDYFELFKI